MFRSMTAFSKAETSDKGTKVSIEIKSVNGRNLDINCRFPKSVSHREFAIREIIKQQISRGNLNVYINIEKDKDQDLNEEEIIDGVNPDQLNNCQRFTYDLIEKFSIKKNKCL